MRKNINGKTNKRKKHTMIFIVILIFLLFISSFFALSNRRFLFIETGLKNMVSKVNEYFIDKLYDDDEFKDLMSNSKISYLQKENNELRKNLSLKEVSQKYVTAEVTNRVAKTFLNQVGISKGYGDGIEKGLPVITPSGLVGFISRAGKDISEVRLLTSVNKNNMVSVLIDNDGTYISGVLSDYDVSKGMFKVTDVVAKTNSLVGKKVVLAGYDNEVYKGIYVGEVSKEEVSDHGLSKTIWVTSGVNFDDLLFVAVVTNK